MTNRSDRSTAFLFADGAGAAVIGPSDILALDPWSGALMATRRR